MQAAALLTQQHDAPNTLARSRLPFDERGSMSNNNVERHLVISNIPTLLTWVRHRRRQSHRGGCSRCLAIRDRPFPLRPLVSAFPEPRCLVRAGSISTNAGRRASRSTAPGLSCVSISAPVLFASLVPSGTLRVPGQHVGIVPRAVHIPGATTATDGSGMVPFGSSLGFCNYQSAPV